MVPYRFSFSLIRFLWLSIHVSCMPTHNHNILHFTTMVVIKSGFSSVGIVQTKFCTLFFSIHLHKDIVNSGAKWLVHCRNQLTQLISYVFIWVHQFSLCLNNLGVEGLLNLGCMVGHPSNSVLASVSCGVKVHMVFEQASKSVDINQFRF